MIDSWLVGGLHADNSFINYNFPEKCLGYIIYILVYKGKDMYITFKLCGYLQILYTYVSCIFRGGGGG